MHSKTAIHTPKAAGYLAQLCKHFGHKTEVEQDAEGAVFHFSDGLARVNSESSVLNLRVEAETAPKLRNLEHIVGSHLERFAFRENLRVTWNT